MDAVDGQVRRGEAGLSCMVSLMTTKKVFNDGSTRVPMMVYTNVKTTVVESRTLLTMVFKMMWKTPF